MGNEVPSTASVFQLASRFTSDELSIIIGTCTPDAVAIINPINGRIEGCNEGFRELIDPEVEGVDRLHLDSYIHPDDLRSFKFSRSKETVEDQDPVEVRIKSVGDYFKAQVVFSSLRWERQEFLLAYIRPVKLESEIEKELKGRITTQKRKTLDAIKSSLLIYQFTEKIKKTPLLTTTLLGAVSNEEIFERASKILTSEGLNYKGVSFYLVEEDELQIQYSTQATEGESFKLSEKNRYTDFFKNEEQKVLECDQSILVNLTGREESLGFLEIELHEREKIFFDELNLVRKWQKDALTTFADMIALLMENLRLYEEVRIQSITDPLTGVYNRHYFTDCLPQEVQRCKEHEFPLTLIFIDIDYFKTINDTYGHLAGDKILAEMGQLLKRNFRGYDFICRYGGDEFVVLLTEISEEDARRIAQEFLDVVRSNDFGIEDDNFSLSLSMGICFCGKDISGEDFLRSADDALYKAKETGRDKLVVSKPEVEQPVLENLSPKKQFREKRGDSQEAPVARKNSPDEEEE